MRLSEFRLLTDENIDPGIVHFLRAQGFDVLDAKEQGLMGSDDLTLLRLSQAENRVVLTHDSDFGTLAVAAAEPFVGIIYLRPGHFQAEFTIGSLEAILAQDIDLNPPFIIVAVRTGNRIKVRVRQS